MTNIGYSQPKLWVAFIIFLCAYSSTGNVNANEGKLLQFYQYDNAQHTINISQTREDAS